MAEPPVVKSATKSVVRPGFAGHPVTFIGLQSDHVWAELTAAKTAAAARRAILGMSRGDSNSALLLSDALQDRRAG